MLRPRRLAPLLAAALALLPGGAARAQDAASPPPAWNIGEIASPAAPGSRGAALAAGAAGPVWIAWVEPLTGGGGGTLRCAAFDAADGRWEAARTIASSPDLMADDDDPPALLAEGGWDLTAAWPARSAGAGGRRLLVSHSEDKGKTWSAPVPLSRESDATDEAALALQPGGHVLAAWVDRRGAAEDPGKARLYARFLDAAPGDADRLIDDSVCSRCAPSLAAFIDGEILVAYRSWRAQGVRDIRTARLVSGTWETSVSLQADGWKPLRDPSFGAALADDGGRLVAVWPTAADGDPRLLATSSPDAGRRLLNPIAIDNGGSPDSPAVALLHDGAAVVVWRESAIPDVPGSLWLRRITPDFSAQDPIALVPPQPDEVAGPPRLALARDYAGSDGSAEAIAAFTQQGAQPGVRTFRIELPEGAWLAAADDACRCAPAPADLVGYPVRGTVSDVASDKGQVTIETDAAPGVLPEGGHVFRTDRDTLNSLKPGQQCLGRIELRAGQWWLFDVRLLETPPE